MEVIDPPEIETLEDESDPEREVPDIDPPVIVTAFAFCVAIVPKVPVALTTKAVVAIWVEFVPVAAVGAVGTPVNAGELLSTTEPDPVELVAPVPPCETATEPFVNKLMLLF